MMICSGGVRCNDMWSVERALCVNDMCRYDWWVHCDRQGRGHVSHVRYSLAILMQEWRRVSSGRGCPLGKNMSQPGLTPETLCV